MSDDLISRRELYERAATLEAQALDYVGKLIERDGEEYSTEWKIWSAILVERTAFKHDVFDAPSAQRTGRWIPVSERLPEESGWYLVSVKTGNVTTAYYRVAEADKGGCYWRDGVKKPTAWMPLPEPYEEVQK